MEIIPYAKFARLRMNQFVPLGTKIFELSDYEWMGGVWVNEGIRGFTGMSRHRETPDETGGLELSFPDLPPAAALAILDALQLPLRPGMKFEHVVAALCEPKRTHVYTADRKTHDFNVGRSNPYHVSTTVHLTDGLIYLTVIRKDILAKCDI